jgi:hypothetical protein
MKLIEFYVIVNDDNHEFEIYNSTVLISYLISIVWPLATNFKTVSNLKTSSSSRNKTRTRPNKTMTHSCTSSSSRLLMHGNLFLILVAISFFILFSVVLLIIKL